MFSEKAVQRSVDEALYQGKPSDADSASHGLRTGRCGASRRGCMRVFIVFLAFVGKNGHENGESSIYLNNMWDIKFQMLVKISEFEL
jgi:hypothetical protein